MKGTIFPYASLDRRAMPWEEHAHRLTPVTTGESGVLYKREDWFAPLGYGGINGSKLRQLVHLVEKHLKSHPETRGVITGASVLSPQVSMSALVAKHYGLDITIVLGATKPTTAPRHENVAIARAAGASFRYIPVGFNPALQSAVRQAKSEPAYQDYYRLCYGITTPEEAHDQDVEEFHAVGAPQVNNIPRDIRTLVMTAGSCNSAASVLYGIARRTPPNLERVVLIGIGPTRLEWIKNRFRQIERASGVKVWPLFTHRYHHHPELGGGAGPILLEHYDLHATRWTSYQQKRRWHQDGIDFHPTYEGKMLAWLHEQQLGWWKRAAGDVLVWVVGSAVSHEVMRPVLEDVR
jgi:hypothetical protein